MRKPEFVYVTYIETTPEKLWEALTDGDFTERYWFGARLKSNWKVGSSFEMLHGDGTVSDAGKVVECDRPRRLAYTFVNLSEKYKNDRPALATFVIEPYGNLVKLTLTHEGFAEGSKFFDGISKGWPAILSSLKSILETGHPLEIPFEALKFED
ncbi:MAG: SRPBCC family protein [Bradyrhizobium sp.]|uniref:SRPBCC family protein n=1 Tax=Bradyrhizobium sp. TaxID=376 RepID=UPI001C29F8E7|nr:SRPBCC family protein [Bradyrhizobium sp.]MBU6464337.1 SRPBCC family protein [Pseudomonadota bacterium]MDE2068223.1 SRPBCC family protein [Bradyrhizobium sp.]MDE2244116.1 SRPBCC family protein [Bradyrhizobium sp.]MDE2472727.1 SRPBCC family protein [Bradyrhizobium sp.]